MPALSPTMTEGTLAKWLIGEGDAIHSGDIIAEIDAGDLGLGSYMAEISVDASAGNAGLAPGCQKSDDGEDVVYNIELIVFEYDIKAYVDLEEL